MKNAAKIQQQIADLQDVLNDPEASSLAKELAQEEIAELQGKLAKTEKAKAKPEVAEPKRRGRPAAPPKRAKKEHPPYDGPAIDADGNTIKVGDAVTYYPKGGGEIKATVINLKRHQGGGHQIKYTGTDGKTKTPMVQPEQLRLADSADTTVLSTHEKIPAEAIAKAYEAGRKDCEQNKVVLVKPKGKTKVSAPMVANPDDGDVIVANKQGHAMYVATGQAVKDDYQKGGEMKPETTDGMVTAFLDNHEGEPETAAAVSDSDDKRTYKSVKASKPQKACKGTQEKMKSPALLLFLEGMRMKWHSGDSLDKITRVLFDNDRKKLVLEIDSYNALDWNVGYRYYDICPESGRMTKISSSEAANASTLMGKAAMKEFYRHPYSASCARVSRALYVECYRKGACDTERKKRLYGIFAGKCSKEIKLGQEYQKFLHKQAREEWKGPKSGESYAQVFQRVAKKAKA